MLFTFCIAVSYCATVSENQTHSPDATQVLFRTSLEDLDVKAMADAVACRGDSCQSGSDNSDTRATKLLAWRRWCGGEGFGKEPLVDLEEEHKNPVNGIANRLNWARHGEFGRRESIGVEETNVVKSFTLKTTNEIELLSSSRKAAEQTCRAPIITCQPDHVMEQRRHTRLVPETDARAAWVQIPSC